MPRPSSRLAIIIVHYHTPQLLGQAVDALIDDLSTSGLNADLWVVDNGSWKKDQQTLVQLPAQILNPGKNLGYAGGINLGVAQTDAEMLCFMNADVKVQPGCMARLLHVLDSGAAAAGPRFYWDDNNQLMLPPNEEQTRRYQLLRHLAQPDTILARQLRARWRCHARRHWLATEPLLSNALSGALLAVRRDAWETVGPFDDGFQLYYEESDWLIRLKSYGLHTYYVPEAEAVHVYNQSASHHPLAKGWFAQSELRFQRRYYGAWFPGFQHHMAQLAARFPRKHQRYATGNCEFIRQPDPPKMDLDFTNSWSQGPLWVEISSDRLGVPAAASIIRDAHRKKWHFPEEVWHTLQPGTYSMRAVDCIGKELASPSFERPQRSQQNYQPIIDGSN